MGSVDAKQWVLNKPTPPGAPFNLDFKSEDTTFELKRVQLSANDLNDGDILIKTLYISNDPAQKFWIISVDKNYSKGVSKGETIPARGLAKIIASKNKDYPEGSYITTYTNWNTHSILTKEQLTETTRIVSKKEVDELWWYLSVLGSTALTAYFIFYNYAELKERDEDYNKVFLISGAAGAVGSICIQLALNVFHAKKVIAIAGGSEKVKYVESFGDKVIGVDYKDPNFKENLIKAAGGVNTVDYFIDNVGGEILDLGVLLSKVQSKVLACGSISGYNNPEKLVFKNYITVVTKRLVLKGLLLTDNREQFPQAFTKLIELIKAGKINVSNSATIKDATGDKFDQVPLIWNGLFQGINKGKLLTKVNEDD